METIKTMNNNCSIVLKSEVYYVKSYDTLVAIILHDINEIHVDKYYSNTTSKHIGMVAKFLNYKIVKHYV